MIFDPKAPKNTPPFWEHKKKHEKAESRVPKDHEVKVIDGYV